MANNLNYGWLIVCSVCNQHTYSTGEFITHLESHFDLQNNVVRNLYVNYRRELLSNTHQAYFRREMLMQETINVVDARVFPAPPQQPMVMPQPPRTNWFPNVNQVAASQPIQPPIQFQPGVMTYAGSTVAETAQLPAPAIHPIHPEMMEMEVSTVDGTKPYINLLEKPIDNNEFVNGVNMYGANPNLQILDLDLKL